MPLFLDELEASVVSRIPTDFVNKTLLKKKRINFGTRIEIACIRKDGAWNERKITKVVEAIQRLTTPPFFTSKKEGNNFEVGFYRGDDSIPVSDPKQERLHTLLEDKRLFHIEGRFDGDKCFLYSLTTSISGREKTENRSLALDDDVLKKITAYKKTFSEEIDRPLECGSFGFCFYIFDFSQQTLPKYTLGAGEKEIIKNHRVYLYRDGIRVYPYGDPEDDWLGIDVLRGTVRAGENFSNGQVVGYITITQAENKKLQDKTNREGLIESGNATGDFIGLIKIFLGYVRRTDYQRFRAKYENNRETIKANDIYNQKKVETSLMNAEEAIKEGKSNAGGFVRVAHAEYKKEREYLTRRVEITEHLAGVGLSVESASHDIMMVMTKALRLNDDLIRETREEPVAIDNVHTSLNALRGMLSFIESTLKNIQQLFRSSKQRRKNIRVNDTVKNVHSIFKNLLAKQKITLDVQEIGSPLVVKTTDAVLLQTLINLFDNAIYWQTDRQENRKIEIRLDGDSQELIFSDNGIGVREEDVPYIFEPFYSGKGVEGRGLGLYIARQLLEKDDFTIHLMEKKSEKYLSGANFIVRFYSEEE
jgi:signal transduction histidine kinase